MNYYNPYMPIYPTYNSNPYHNMQQPVQPMQTSQAQPQPQLQTQQYQATPQTRQEQVSQPGQFQQSQSKQYEYPIQTIKFVTSEEARDFLLAPETQAILIDEANKKVFLKKTDGLGKLTTRYFNYIETNSDGTPVDFGFSIANNNQDMKAQSTASANPYYEDQKRINLNDFIKKDEIGRYFDKYGFVTAEQYNLLSEELNALKIQIRGLKQCSEIKCDLTEKGIDRLDSKKSDMTDKKEIRDIYETKESKKQPKSDN